MPNHDFRTLSPAEFEHLTLDLLQREWNVKLESFKAGRDRGIDLRYSTPSSHHKIVVQCKRYEPSALSQLKRDLIQKELPKVKALSPVRYVIATSVGMNPDDKQEILDQFIPFCQGPHDILARDDLNGLLGRYPEIEQRHVKLWLSGVPMLERLLHADVFNLTAATVDAVREELSRIVIHEGVVQARQVLEKNHHVIIVGIPGIGKTTAARLLLAEHLHDGDEAVCVTGDIAEAWSVITNAMHDRKRRLVVYYDDFLGQTSLEARFNKNEEQRLSRLVELTRRLSNVRLIMTTRDYILEQAKGSYECFARAEPGWAKCTVKLEHFDEPRRARILYQHLYFSDLPNSCLEAMLQTKAHIAIVRHENFSPRIVATVCQRTATEDLDGAPFAKAVVAKLDHPDDVWRHPFEDQLADEARLLLMVLVCFPGAQAQIEDLDRSCRTAAPEFSVNWGPLACERALRVTEGTFTLAKCFNQSGSKATAIVVGLHNPSIQDFLCDWLSKRPQMVQMLYRNAGSYQQTLGLLQAQDHDRRHLFRDALVDLGPAMVESAWRHLDTLEYEIFGNGPFLFGPWPQRVAFLARIVGEIGRHDFRSRLYDRFRSRIDDCWTEATWQHTTLADWVPLFWGTVQKTMDLYPLPSRPFPKRLAKWLWSMSKQVNITSEARVLAKVWADHAAVVNDFLDVQKLMRRLGAGFQDALKQMDRNDEDDLNAWYEAQSDDEKLAKLLGTSWPSHREKIRVGIERTLENLPPDLDDERHRDDWQIGDETDIEQLFSTVTVGREDDPG